MVLVRPAVRGDIAALTEIYNAAVAESLATFDEEPATIEERTGWFHQFADEGPHRLLVATDGADGPVVGYAGSVPYRTHPAFAETVEFTVYLDPAARGTGVGSALYETLLDAVSGEDVHCVVAGIALPNPASVALHRRFGFEEVGVFREYARKRGERISSLWMQLVLPTARS